MDVAGKTKMKTAVATRVQGTVRWIIVKNVHRFNNRHDNHLDVFVHHSAIKRNNPKLLRSVGDGQVVDFDVVVGQKGLEAADVTGLCRVPVKESQWYLRRLKGRQGRREPRQAVGEHRRPPPRPPKRFQAQRGTSPLTTGRRYPPGWYSNGNMGQVPRGAVRPPTTARYRERQPLRVVDEGNEGCGGPCSPSPRPFYSSYGRRQRSWSRDEPEVAGGYGVFGGGDHDGGSSVTRLAPDRGRSIPGGITAGIFAGSSEKGAATSKACACSGTIVLDAVTAAMKMAFHAVRERIMAENSRQRRRPAQCLRSRAAPFKASA
ncbi:hypothetical protein HPB48_020798 [Haemaphysalis longicornis]|uniref:CSD domain-containing protein n=1 Tax=Haemaphysalis longicornis TaxID=44386 RepID=A0A9J6H072_HAELO|nr:hypothetical protein HPB48_020798 [Haemaphysalis longicornis]